MDASEFTDEEIRRVEVELFEAHIVHRIPARGPARAVLRHRRTYPYSQATPSKPDPDGR